MLMTHYSKEFWKTSIMYHYFPYNPHRIKPMISGNAHITKS